MIVAPLRHRVVLAYGRFDRFDQHHGNLLRHLSGMGDELIVGCVADALADIDDRPCIQTFDTRRAMLERCRFVSRVISQDTSDQAYTDIVNYNISLFVMSDVFAGQFDDLRDITMVRYLPDYDSADIIASTAHIAFA